MKISLYGLMICCLTIMDGWVICNFGNSWFGLERLDVVMALVFIGND